MADKKHTTSKPKLIHTIRVGEVAILIEERQTNAGIRYKVFTPTREWVRQGTARRSHGSPFFTEQHADDLVTGSDKPPLCCEASSRQRRQKTPGPWKTTNTSRGRLSPNRRWAVHRVEATLTNDSPITPLYVHQHPSPGPDECRGRDWHKVQR